jgi:predicted pyridoxine 5'-phosphate oxidase superfamily flavin-nucleotide-binding protein
LNSILYHEGNRRLQDEFESRRIADRLEEKLARTRFTADDVAFIEGRSFFFMATADAAGRPDCSFKGGPAGFVRVSGPSEIAFPDYDGNGMFKSLGNLLENSSVGLLFLDFEKPRRLRVNGRAEVRRDDPLIASTPGAQLMVRVTATAIFPNCPRYIPTMHMMKESLYTPRPRVVPIEPGWKTNPDFRDFVHPRRQTAGVDQATLSGAAAGETSEFGRRPPEALNGQGTMMENPTLLEKT